MDREDIGILIGFALYALAWPFIWLASKVQGQIAPEPLELSYIFCEWDNYQKEVKILSKLRSAGVDEKIYDKMLKEIEESQIGGRR